MLVLNLMDATNPVEGQPQGLQPVLQTVQKTDDGVWVVRIERPNGRPQLFRCSTEAQAQALLQVLAPAQG